MIKLYRELFYIPKHGRISEKNMLARMVSTIAIVVVCLAAMSITAYAYFSANITSGSNIIKSATFETKVNVQITDTNGEAVEVRTSDYKTHAATLQGGSSYYITLQHTERSTAKTGFIIVTASNCKERYHTQQLGKDGDGNTETVRFWIKPSADTEVTFTAHWGTSSYYPDFKGISDESDLYIKNGETIALSIAGTVNAVSGDTDWSGAAESTTETTTSTEAASASDNSDTSTSENPTGTTGANEATETTGSEATTTTETTATESAETAATEETQPETTSTETTETTGATITEENSNEE